MGLFFTKCLFSTFCAQQKVFKGTLRVLHTNILTTSIYCDQFFAQFNIATRSKMRPATDATLVCQPVSCASNTLTSAHECAERRLTEANDGFVAAWTPEFLQLSTTNNKLHVRARKKMLWSSLSFCRRRHNVQGKHNAQHTTSVQNTSSIQTSS